MKFVVDDKIPYIDGLLESYAEVLYLPGRDFSSAVVKDADALVIRTRTKCNEALLAGSSVKAIFTATIGFDHIDTRYCEANGIHWQSAPGCNSSSVQQYVASVLSALHLDGKICIPHATIAVVGVGNVGSKVADWCRKLGMNVLLVDPFVKLDHSSGYVKLEDALPQSDVVSFHTPLTREGDFATYHLLNVDTVRLLKKGAVVVNTSRGEVCSTEALLRGLDCGQISDVVIDVWENEPDVNADLLKRSYIATPHVAGYSYDSKRNGTEMTMHSLNEFFSLGMRDFISGELPGPEHAVLSIDKCLSYVDAACQMFLHTYNVLNESAFFKAHPDLFEQFRGDYPLRREIGAYLLPADCSQSSFLEKFGVQCQK